MEDKILNIQIEVPVKVNKNVENLIREYGQEEVEKALKDAIELKVFLQLCNPLENAIEIDEDLYDSLSESLSYQESLGIEMTNYS